MEMPLVQEIIQQFLTHERIKYSADTLKEILLNISDIAGLQHSNQALLVRLL